MQRDSPCLHRSRVTGSEAEYSFGRRSARLKVQPALPCPPPPARVDTLHSTTNTKYDSARNDSGACTRYRVLGIGSDHGAQRGCTEYNVRHQAVLIKLFLAHIVLGSLSEIATVLGPVPVGCCWFRVPARRPKEGPSRRFARCEARPAFINIWSLVVCVDRVRPCLECCAVCCVVYL